MGKRKSDSQIRKAAYSAERYSLLRKGVDRETANARAREAGAAAVERVHLKREADRVYWQAKTEALRMGAPADVALDEAKRARRAKRASQPKPKPKRGKRTIIRLSTAEPIAERAAPDLSQEFCCTVEHWAVDGDDHVLIDEIASWEDSFSLPVDVQALIPTYGAPVLGGHYSACTQSEATRFYSFICTGDGRVIAQTPTALKPDDAAANAGGMMQIAQYYKSLQDSDGGKYFIITIFARFRADLAERGIKAKP